MCSTVLEQLCTPNPAWPNPPAAAARTAGANLRSLWHVQRFERQRDLHVKRRCGITQSNHYKSSRCIKLLENWRRYGDSTRLTRGTNSSAFLVNPDGLSRPPPLTGYRVQRISVPRSVVDGKQTIDLIKADVCNSNMTTSHRQRYWIRVHTLYRSKQSFVRPASVRYSVGEERADGGGRRLPVLREYYHNCVESVHYQS